MTGRKRDQGGQTLVEFAIILPAFALALFGLIDGGFLVYANSALSQGAREGARVASAEASWIGLSGDACVSDASGITDANPGAHVCPTDVASFKAHVTSAVNGTAVGLGSITTVYLSCNAGTEDDPVPAGNWTDGAGGDGNGCQDGSGNPLGATGELVSVRVEYTHDTFTPLLSSIIGSVPLSGAATMTIS